jgi:uncharacterized tellurite resistance protein B-like protein
MENKVNKQHFKNLLSVAYADGILDRAELEFLFKKSDKYYISAEDVEGLIENTIHITPLEIADRDDRAKKMLELIQMMLIDGEASEIEKRLCASFGVSIGFLAEKVEAIVDSVIHMLDDGRSEYQVLEIIKKSE